jgi:hypothetical protein
MPDFAVQSHFFENEVFFILHTSDFSSPARRAELFPVPKILSSSSFLFLFLYGLCVFALKRAIYWTFRPLMSRTKIYLDKSALK